MDFANPLSRDFMLELYSMTSGDPNEQVSMYDVGTALGMEREAASEIAQDLIIDGLLELKTLSGGVAITAEGLNALQVEGTGGTSGIGTLGAGTYLDEADRQTTDAALQMVKNTLSAENLSYQRFEEISLDIKTLEVHLLSPSPSTAVVREIFSCLAARLNQAGFEAAGQEVKAVTSQ